MTHTPPEPDRKPTREYSNGEIVVVWQGDLCIHSANCIRGLPGVFDVRRRPWIDVTGAPTAAIVEQVGRCPSGALAVRPATVADAVAPSAAGRAPEDPEPAPQPTEAAIVTVEPVPGGPLVVRGRIVVKSADGTLVERPETTSFCRCGASARKPFCDGSHRRVGFAD